MRTYLQNTDGTTKEVKNLGWLLHNINIVEGITLSDRDDGARCGCKFTARLSDGRFYITSFNSYQVCKDFVKARRSLKSILVIDLVNLL